jgi:hypothetical protein
MKAKTILLTSLVVLATVGTVRTDDLPGGLPGTLPPKYDMTEPFGDCCVASVRMQSFNAWSVVCGDCSQNPGTYVITQPDPAKAVFLDAAGRPADTRYDAAAASCLCPALSARRAWEKSMRAVGAP